MRRYTRFFQKFNDKIKSIFNRIIDKLFYPFEYDLSYLSLLLILNICICLGMVVLESSILFAISLLLFNYAGTCLLVYLANINKYAGYILKPFFLLVGSTFFIVNCYSLAKYHSRFPMVIIAGTNINEIREYIMMYFSWISLVLFSLFVLCISILLFFAIKKVKYHLPRKKCMPMIILLLVSLFSVGFNKRGIPKLYDNFISLANVADFRYNPTNPTINVETDVLPTYVITIIGESFAPSHSSIYGYDKETNPLLQEKVDRGDLIIFERVLSPATATAETFMYLLNTYRLGMDGYWYNCTNLIEVLKTIGYHSSWLSTQEETGLFNNIPSGNSKICDESVFITNRTGEKYDGALMDCYVSDSDKKQALFYHLCGQHYLFKERYPEEYDIFKSSDYGNFWGGERQREIIAQYDNATLYNDFVVNSLISQYNDYDTVVFYFSDHGLDIYDTDLNYCGHAKNTPESQAIGKKIPFMVYLSPKYQQLRPALSQRIRNATNKDFCTDKLIYAVMDAVGVKFADTEDVAEFSLFSEE